ncbi:MAG: hypothetical protein ACRD1Y_03005, partial [Terriglobales bacterium]
FPAGTSENVVAALQAAAVRQPLHLDAEGNVVASAPHAAPALALGVVLFNSTISGDADNAWSLPAGSGTHLRIWGTAMAMLVSHLQPLAMALGYIGAGKTIYSRYVARGENVVFPKDSELVIRLSPLGPHGPALPPVGASLPGRK